MREPRFIKITVISKADIPECLLCAKQFHVLCLGHLLSATRRGRCCHYVYIDEESDAQKGELVCLRYDNS